MSVDQSAYARVSTSVPNDDAKSMIGSDVDRRALELVRGGSSPPALSFWNELRPFTWSYREITMLSKSR